LDEKYRFRKFEWDVEEHEERVPALFQVGMASASGHRHHGAILRAGAVNW
jgi:hypothetical protein